MNIATFCVTLLTLLPLVSSQSCLRPIYYSGCTDSSQCAPANGNKLECRLPLNSTDASPKQCLCPKDGNCKSSADSSKAAQYEECSSKPCSDYGIVDQNSSQGCAEKLFCVTTNPSSNPNEQKTSWCYTCSTCRQHGRRFDCSAACAGVENPNPGSASSTPSTSTKTSEKVTESGNVTAKTTEDKKGSKSVDSSAEPATKASTETTTKGSAEPSTSASAEPSTASSSNSDKKSKTDTDSSSIGSPSKVPGATSAAPKKSESKAVTPALTSSASRTTLGAMGATLVLGMLFACPL